MGRQSPHAHDSSGRILPPIELRDGWRANCVGGMSATVTVKRRNMRSFDVNERHTRGDFAMAATSLGDYFEPSTDFFFRRRNDGGRETGHAIGQHHVDKANY